jgi:IS4 transposase
MDRGYVDFARLRRFTFHAAFFVTRAKRNLDYACRARRQVDKTTGLRSDQTILLAGPKSSQLHPEPLRRVSFYDAEKGRRLVLLTNNFTLPALTIAALYKSRWQVELFFKGIKQHLRIKAFYGTTPHAVKTQVWVAICVYLLVAIVKRELRIDRSPYEILQILSVTLFEKTPIFEALSVQKIQDSEVPGHKQLMLFDL